LGILRAGFEAAMQDRALIDEGQQTERPISSMTGEEAASAIAELYAIPSDVVARTRATLSK
jgi:hypothetical protein